MYENEHTLKLFSVEYLRIIQEKQQTLGDRARIGINTDIS
jgi:hypothetical protein